LNSLSRRPLAAPINHSLKVWFPLFERIRLAGDQGDLSSARQDPVVAAAAISQSEGEAGGKVGGGLIVGPFQLIGMPL